MIVNSILAVPFAVCAYDPYNPSTKRVARCAMYTAVYIYDTAHVTHVHYSV